MLPLARVWTTARPAAVWVALAALTVMLVPVMGRGDAQRLLLVIAGGLVALVLIQQPYVCLLLVFAGWFLRAGPATYVATAILLVPLAMAIYGDRRFRALDALQVRALLGIAACYVLSTWWNEFLDRIPVMGGGSDETRTELTIFAMRALFILFVFYFVTTPLRIAGLTWMLIALIAIAAATALPPVLSGAGFRRAHTEFGLAGNANRLAHICLFATSLIWFYRCHGGDRRLKTLTVPLLVILPLTALASASRSGLLQMFVLGVMVLKEQQGWSPIKRMRSVVVLAALGLAVVAVVPTANLMRATTFDRSHVGQGQDSLKNRFNTVVAALEIITRDPVLGIGIGNFRAVKRAEYGLPRKEGTHNSYLWALLAGGPVVLALHLMMFYTTWRVVRHVERWGPPELVWIAKGMKVNVLLFLLFSCFADFWLSEMFAVVIAIPLALAQITATAQQAPTSSPRMPAWAT
jgi:hypothetical protein